MIATDGMMMRDGAACRDQRIARRILDGLPLLKKRAVSTKRVEGKIGCRPVRVDVGEAASDFTLHAGRFQNGALGCRFDLIVKVFELIPGDGGLERIVDEARGCQKFARIGHANEPAAPDPRRALQMRVAGLGGPPRPALVGAPPPRARPPGPDRLLPRPP